MRCMKRTLAVHAIRVLAVTQSVPLVVVHAGWIALALLTWGEAAGDGSSMQQFSRTAWRAYAWMGGTDADGHGDINNLMSVWAKLALLVYGLEVVARRFGPRWGPLRWWILPLVSGVVAAGGWTLATWPERVTSGVAADAGWLLGFVVLFAFLAAAWVMLVRRVADAMVARILLSDRTHSAKSPLPPMA